MRTPMFATLAILAIAAPALAQRVPKFGVSAGYSAMADRELDETFHGWVTSVTGHVNNWLGIKGEVGGHYKTLAFDDVGPNFAVTPGEANLDVHSFLAGPTFTSRPAGNRVRAFAHVLAGAAVGRVRYDGETERVTAFALQPGGGFDIGVTRNVAVRVGADYRHLFTDEPGHETRVLFGIVLNGGSR